MEQLLTKLKTIEPKQEFKARSRMLVLSAPQTSLGSKIFRQFLGTVQFSAAFGLAAIFLFIMLNGSSMLNPGIPSAGALSSLDPEQLTEEANNLDIQIRLSQAEYYDSSAVKIEVALKETSDELRNSKNREEKLNQLLNELTL